ncbi:unnamed protein product [Rangifer tarandus platyrhynchus]|uniref:Uncharacterized protein n=1 Tax=Rangifer tarandus platyrhynchus TaxID=3082113 RepID=A0ABN8ZFK2_RANTA|nr:unnamed protein product [Rangifer tarandus platyrhynchus]
MDTDTRAAWAEEGPSEDTATCKPKRGPRAQGSPGRAVEGGEGPEPPFPRARRRGSEKAEASGPLGSPIGAGIWEEKLAAGLSEALREALDPAGSLAIFDKGRQAVGADGTGAHPRESAPQTRSPRPLNPPGPRLDAPVLPAPYLPRSRIPERHPFTPLPPPRTRCQVP